MEGDETLFVIDTKGDQRNRFEKAEKEDKQNQASTSRKTNKRKLISDNNNIDEDGNQEEKATSDPSTSTKEASVKKGKKQSKKLMNLLKEKNYGAWAEQDAVLSSQLFGNKSKEQILNLFGKEDQIVEEDAETKDSKQELEDGPAWRDEDDDALSVDISSASKKLKKDLSEKVISGTEYSQRLREQFKKLTHQPVDWAAVPTTESPEDDILKTTKSLTASGQRLPQLLIDVVRLKDVNYREPSNHPILVTKYHPNSQIVMTAGNDKRLRLFQVDSVNNALLSSVYFKEMPIFSASWMNEGQEVLVSGRRNFFYVHNIVTGQTSQVPTITGRPEKSYETSFVSPDQQYIAILGINGFIIILSAQSKKWLTNFKINGGVTAATFSPDSKYLYATGTEGTVYQFDMRNRKCVHKFADEGTVRGTAITVSPDNRYLTTGSDVGIVNVYDVSTLHQSARPSPVKSLGQLTKQADLMQFHPDSQLFGIASSTLKESLRFVHVPSFTIFSNWPTGRTPLAFVRSFDFSPDMTTVAIGNDGGKVLLYRLNHYRGDTA